MAHQDLLTQLDHHLGGSHDADDDVLVAAMTGLTTALQRAVSGWAGLRVTVVQSGHPVSLEAIPPGKVDQAETSLGIPLPLLSPACEAGGRIVFFSSVPGAFVDLAADLTYLLDRSTTTHTLTVEVDADLPLTSHAAGLTGFEDLSTLNRAAGILIDQGHHPDTVHQALRSQAAAAGLTAHGFAIQLLGH